MISNNIARIDTHEQHIAMMIEKKDAERFAYYYIQSSRRYQFVVGNKVLLAEQRTNTPFVSSQCVATDRGHVCLWHNMEGGLIGN